MVEKISKTTFKKENKCKAYPGLNYLKYKSMNKNLTIDDIMEIENDNNKMAIFRTMINDEGDSIFNKIDKKLEVFMQYYNELELHSGRKVQNCFGGKVQYSLDTRKQKYFVAYIAGSEFYCFLDVYQEDEGKEGKIKKIRVVEVKGTTTSRFMNLGGKVKVDVEKESVFIPIFENVNGILKLKDETIGYEGIKNQGVDVNKYKRQRDKLLNKHSNVGVYVYDLAFQRMVIESYFSQNGMFDNIDNIEYYLCVLNNDYIHDGVLIDSNKLMTLIDLTQITKEYRKTLKDDVNRLLYYRSKKITDGSKYIGRQCRRNTHMECEFYDLCSKSIPKKNNVFNYMRAGSNKYDGKTKTIYDILHLGRKTMLDMPLHWLDNQNHIIQYETLKYNKVFIDVKKMKDVLSLLEYPLYYLDFESFNCPIPRYKNEKPYTQSVFQASLHIEREKGKCDFDNDHYEYLAKDMNDHRLDIVKFLVNNIKNKGNIIVYNKTFESLRLLELSKLFPEYKNELLDIRNRLFDLLDVIRGNSKLLIELGYDKEIAKRVIFYDHRQQGSYSLKKVLPVLSDLSYSNLEINNGMSAMVNYASYETCNSQQEFEQLRKNLIYYCKQDTWAEVLILHKLYYIVDNYNRLENIIDIYDIIKDLKNDINKKG